jgi:polyisoprenoid-binding protein YceI
MRTLAILLLLQPWLAAETLTISAGSGPVRLTVLKTGLMSGKKHVFEFPSYRAQIEYDRGTPANSRVELTIDAARFDLKDDWLSAKDQRKVADYAREKMLDAGRYSTIRFRSREILERAPGEFTVRGDLVIRDRTRPVEVTVKRVESGGSVEFQGSAAVDMREFGLDPPKAALGTIGTNPRMLVEFRFQAAAPPRN